MFRSGYEKRVKEHIERRKVKVGYEDTKLSYSITHNYIPDFTLYGKKQKGKERIIYVEAKGRFTATDRTKMKAVKEQHPDKDIRILFQVNQPIRKGSKTMNTDWADKNGYKSAVGEDIPDLWYKELLE